LALFQRFAAFLSFIIIRVGTRVSLPAREVPAHRPVLLTARHASWMRPSGLRSVRMHLLCSLMSARRPDPSFPASLRAACDPWAPGDALQPYCRICEARGSPLPHAAAPADRTNPRCAALVAKRTVPARSANQDVVRPKLCAAVPSEVPTSSESPFGDRGDTP